MGRMSLVVCVWMICIGEWYPLAKERCHWYEYIYIYDMWPLCLMVWTMLTSCDENVARVLHASLEEIVIL